MNLFWPYWGSKSPPKQGILGLIRAKSVLDKPVFKNGFVQRPAAPNLAVLGVQIAPQTGYPGSDLVHFWSIFGPMLVHFCAICQFSSLPTQTSVPTQTSALSQTCRNDVLALPLTAFSTLICSLCPHFI